MRRRRTATAEVYADFRGNSIKKPSFDKAKKRATVGSFRFPGVLNI